LYMRVTMRIVDGLLQHLIKKGGRQFDACQPGHVSTVRLKVGLSIWHETRRPPYMHP
jgi:hypothetical protein